MTMAAATLLLNVTCASAERRSRRGETQMVMRCDAGKIVVDFDPEGLTATEEDAFTRLAAGGVADLEHVMAPVLETPAGDERPIRFIVSDRVSMSRTFGRTVLLPLSRVREKRAPYLHESVHALLPASHQSTWLSEGLACHLESWVAENVGGYDAHVFTSAGDRRIHDAARRYLQTDLGRAVLPWVGAPGEPPDLFENRDEVARPFYVLSQSFTKYLVEKLGLTPVLRLASEADPEEALARVSGRDAEHWRAEWRSGLFMRPVVPSS